ncbi:hypothetical protein ACH4L7_30075 [Streptomyces anulatus]
MTIKTSSPARTAADALAVLEEALDTTPNLSDRDKRNARRNVETPVREHVREHEKALVTQAEAFAVKAGGVADDMASIEQEIDGILRELRDNPAASAVEAYERFSLLQAEAGKRFAIASTFIDAYAGHMEVLEDPVSALSHVQQKFPPLLRSYGI